MRPIITLTTDFGEGSYVAQMKGVLLSLCPDSQIIDLAHNISPQNVAEGASLLSEAAVKFPSQTIHIAVVDPGVGTSRPLVYAEIGSWRFLAPDNGLLQKVAESFPIHRIVQLENAVFWRTPLSNTFHGRDILCPVAGYLANGGSAEMLGSPRENLVPCDFGRAQRQGNQIVGCIQRIDTFGNLITNLSASDFGTFLGDFVKIELWNGKFTLPFVRTYGNLGAGRIAGLFGSSKWFEIAVVQGNAQKTLRAKLGDGVVVQLPG